MVRKILTYLLLSVLLFPFCSYAQNSKSKKTAVDDEENLVRLVSADTLQLVQIRGVTYRKVKGHPARFLHNNTYLICDSALWNVDAKVINALGKVKILQNQTELTSDQLTYYVDRDMAEFRGGLVQLLDKDKNTLRTKYLDYNTKDSVAVFRNGGALRDKDGQIIESRTGTYDSKIKTFTFTDDVNMFTDSVFVKTTTLKYESDLSLATFGYNTNAWKDENMLTANSGWYDRNVEQFFFSRNVHVMSDIQEGWCDSLYFNRNSQDVSMRGNAQVTDTTRMVFAMAGRIDYVDSIAQVTMTRMPAVMAETEEKDDRGRTQKDTVYFGADTLIYYTVKRCDVDSIEVVKSAERLKSVDNDPVSDLRKAAAEAARKAAEEAAANDPNNPNNPELVRAREAAEAAKAAEAARTGKAGPPGGIKKPGAEDLSQQLDSLAQHVDSTVQALDSLAFVSDTLARTDSLGLADSLAAVDSLEPVIEKDTTKIGFVKAWHRVRIFRKSMQVACDSLAYTDLDSLARMYGNPLVWNEEAKHEYAADSIYALVRNQAMEKANLLSNAFIHIQEDTLHYDQIRSTEMTAFFDKDGELSRFDAMGGATALFYIEENDEIATANKKDSKMLSAMFSGGEIERIYYFDAAKSDAYPVVQMAKEDRFLKGFHWEPERRPASKDSITTRTLRPSQRAKYDAVPRAKFKNTEEYFPGYIKDIYRQIAERERLSEEREARRQRDIEVRDSIARADSIAYVQDSLARIGAEIEQQESSKDDKVTVDDIVNAAADSLGVSRDSLANMSLDEALAAFSDSVKAATTPSPEQIKAAEKARQQAAKEQKKKEKQQAREARWAAQDAKIAAKEARKAEKEAAKLRKQKLRTITNEQDALDKEQRIFEKYKAKYEAKKAREDARAASKKH